MEFNEQIEILRRKDKADLSDTELAFLAARRSYLTIDERIYFGLNEETPAPQEAEATEEATEEAPKKRTKKRTKKIE